MYRARNRFISYLGRKTTLTPHLSKLSSPSRRPFFSWYAYRALEAQPLTGTDPDAAILSLFLMLSLCFSLKFVDFR